MKDEEFQREYLGRRYIMLFGGNQSRSLDVQVEQAMRFGFVPHGSLVCPEPRFYIQPMIRDTALPNIETAEAASEWRRGYFGAVAVLLREEGSASEAVRSLFRQGGSTDGIDTLDLALFREHRLLD